MTRELIKSSAHDSQEREEKNWKRRGVPTSQEQEIFNLLQSLVEAAGGRVGVMILWNSPLESTNFRTNTRFRTYRCGLDKYPGERLTAMALETAKKIYRALAEGFSEPTVHRSKKLQRSFEGEAARLGLGRSYALLMPVLADGETTGFFLMLHPQDLPSFLRRYPQMYNLVLNRLEVTVRHANLLYNLMRERSWFDTMVNRSNEGVAIVDKESRVVGINPALERLSGWKAADIAGQPLHKALPISSIGGGHGASVPNTNGFGLTLYNQPSLLNISISADPVEAVLTNRDGQPIDVEVTGLTVRNDKGIPNGWVMTVRDISKRKETERLGKIFLSAMSHELQTPIAVIKGFAGLMSDPEIELSRETILQKSQVILEESERLQKMVKQMLEAASIQAGGINLNCEMVNLDGIASRTIRRLGGLAEGKGLVLEKQVSEAAVTVWGDLSRLEQVMANLVENAIKYSTKGKITISIKDGGSSVIVSVTDQGPGISPEEAQRIFGLFERGQEVKKKIRGSGLGLFISKAIVEAHGGTIGAAAQEGGGSCFYFSLPKKNGDN